MGRACGGQNENEVILLDKKLDREQKDELLSRTVPSRQKQAKEYLQGRSPGTMQRYAPDAYADRREGWVESEETVRDLVDWREEAIY